MLWWWDGTPFLPLMHRALGADISLSALFFGGAVQDQRYVHVGENAVCDKCYVTGHVMKFGRVHLGHSYVKAQAVIEPRAHVWQGVVVNEGEVIPVGKTASLMRRARSRLGSPQSPRSPRRMLLPSPSHCGPRPQPEQN